MAVNLAWHGDDVLRLADKAMGRGINAVRIELQSIARLKASIANTGQVKQVQQRRFGGNKTTRTIYPNSSKPGESPRRRTGFGQKNIVSDYDGTIGRVGFTRLARYMMFHELGINYRRVGKQQRPTIVPALIDNRHRLTRVFFRAAGVRR